MLRFLQKCIALVMSVLLSGCGAPSVPQYRVVEKITVTVSHNAQIREYAYTQPEKMQSILLYLRRMQTYAPEAIAPETFRSDAFRIILHRSDGTQTVYHQIADGFLQKDGGDWEKVDARHASSLLRLLELLNGPQTEARIS